MIVILLGVSGAGKTTVGQLLADELGWKFYEGHELHPRSNVKKMRQGIPLTDMDRWPWLERLRELLGESIARKENVILACSALKEKYREYLQISDEIKWVYLKGKYRLIADRLQLRRDHFMNPILLRSQFEILEEPKGDVVIVDIDATPTKLAQTIRKELQI